MSPPPALLTRSVWRRLHAQDAIHQHAVLAAASMTIPIPLLDMATGLSIQVRMVRKLCELYGAGFDARAARDVVTGIVGGMSVGSLSTTALRYLSFASYVLGPLPSAGLSAAYTYALGELMLSRLIAHGSIATPAAAQAVAPAAPRA